MPRPTIPFIIKDLHFPSAGINRQQGPWCHQPNLPIGPNQTYCRTTPIGVNVLGYDSLHQRMRGGSRPGMHKYLVTTPIAGAGAIADLNVLITVSDLMPTQTSLSGRVVQLLTVTLGNVYWTVPGLGSWNSATNLTGRGSALIQTSVVFSAPNVSKMWYCDGTNYVVYDPATNTTQNWTASSGQLPADSNGNIARLICTWRGRTVLAGVPGSPNVWFMSAVGDPTNWDYNPIPTTPTQAVAGGTGPVDQCGDMITGLIPFNDDILIILCDHTMYMMNGDPNAGGQLDLISDTIGGQWGAAWCKDPYGTIYFVSNRCGVYSLVPGQQPQRISGAVEELLNQINTGQTITRMMWNDRYQGFHLFQTILTGTAGAGSIHFFWEARTGAWWQWIFGNNNHNPLCCCVYDGNTPLDRVYLIGSFDGYVRAIDPSYSTDDGTAIASNVLIGPLLTSTLDDMLLTEIQAILGETSNSVTYNILLGSSAEAAVSASPTLTGTWNAGRNSTDNTRRSAHAIFVQITATSPWAMETIRMKIATSGPIRQRGVY